MAHETGLLTYTLFPVGEKTGWRTRITFPQALTCSGVLASRLRARLTLRDAHKRANSCGAVADFHRLPEHLNTLIRKLQTAGAKPHPREKLRPMPESFL
jgi:hypothetical protein